MATPPPRVDFQFRVRPEEMTPHALGGLDEADAQARWALFMQDIEDHVTGAYVNAVTNAGGDDLWEETAGDLHPIAEPDSFTVSTINGGDISLLTEGGDINLQPTDNGIIYARATALDLVVDEDVEIAANGMGGAQVEATVGPLNLRGQSSTNIDSALGDVQVSTATGDIGLTAARRSSLVSSAAADDDDIIIESRLYGDTAPRVQMLADGTINLNGGTTDSYYVFPDVAIEPHSRRGITISGRQRVSPLAHTRITADLLATGVLELHTLNGESVGGFFPFANASLTTFLEDDPDAPAGLGVVDASTGDENGDTRISRMTSDPDGVHLALVKNTGAAQNTPVIVVQLSETISGLPAELLVDAVGRLYAFAPDAAPDDTALVEGGGFVFRLDEGSDVLQVRVKYGDGTVKAGEINLF